MANQEHFARLLRKFADLRKKSDKFESEDAQEPLAILKQGVVVWNQWRKEHTEVKPDLSHADLRGTDLRGADLRGANLNGAKLSLADLSHADLGRADLSHANLPTANLSGALLDGAILDGANLNAARLSGAILNDANLNGAKLSLADLSHALLLHANLSHAILNDANLSGAYLGRADLSNADLNSANLNDALIPNIKYLDGKYDQNTSKWKRFRTGLYRRSIMRGKYQGIRVASCHGNAIFKRDAEDQDFLDTLEEQWKGTWRIWLFRAWGLIDYGRSMLAVFVIAGFLVVFFGSIYLVFPGLISYSASHPKTWFSPYYFSIVTFTTLGFGDVTANGWLGEMVVSFQVIFGYLTLGLLISILANKVARRS